MASAILDQVAVDIISEDKKNTLRTNGSTIKFPGMYKVYQEAKDDDKRKKKKLFCLQ
jgi:DNA topoisomerase IA